MPSGNEINVPSASKGSFVADGCETGGASNEVADRSIGNEKRENENIMHRTGRRGDRVTISGHKSRAWLSVSSGQLVTTEYLCWRQQ